MIALIFLCLALLCFLLSTFNTPVKPNLQSAGLAFLTLSFIVASKFFNS